MKEELVNLINLKLGLKLESNEAEEKLLHIINNSILDKDFSKSILELSNYDLHIVTFLILGQELSNESILKILKIYEKNFDVLTYILYRQSLNEDILNYLFEKISLNPIHFEYIIYYQKLNEDLVEKFLKKNIDNKKIFIKLILEYQFQNLSNNFIIDICKKYLSTSELITNINFEPFFSKEECIKRAIHHIEFVKEYLIKKDERLINNISNDYFLLSEVSINERDGNFYYEYYNLRKKVEIGKEIVGVTPLRFNCCNRNLLKFNSSMIIKVKYEDIVVLNREILAIRKFTL